MHMPRLTSTLALLPFLALSVATSRAGAPYNGTTDQTAGVVDTAGSGSESSATLRVRLTPQAAEAAILDRHVELYVALLDPVYDPDAYSDEEASAVRVDVSLEGDGSVDTPSYPLSLEASQTTFFFEIGDGCPVTDEAGLCTYDLELTLRQPEGVESVHRLAWDALLTVSGEGLGEGAARIEVLTPFDGAVTAEDL